MTTEAAKRAMAALKARRKAEGLERVTVWLSREARFKLDALKATVGSKDKAVDAAILAWSGSPPRKAVKEEAVYRPQPLVTIMKARAETATMQPIDPLTGKPLPPRRPMQKGAKR